MNSARIKEIQATTACPDSNSIQQALLQVWNECAQEAGRCIAELEETLGGFKIVHLSQAEEIDQLIREREDAKERAEKAERERDEALERIAPLKEWVRSTAKILDPDCPDIDAYVDGHCALAGSAQGVLERAEKAERERDAARAKVAKLREALDSARWEINAVHGILPEIDAALEGGA